MHRAALSLVLTLALAPPAAATPVRMFAVGHKVRTADATTYASFHDRMAALMDAGFPGRVTLVQAGVDDVASHLFPTDPAAPPNALVVLPEETGLVAALTGSRGTAARAQTTATDAIVALFGPYNAPYGYYRTRYPGQPPVRTLVLALTDPSARSPVATLATTAGDYNIFLGFVTITVRVSRDAAPFVTAVSRPAPVPPDHQLLGDGDLAGVALGTPDTDAEQRLIAIFGPPIRTTPWGDSCSGQFRYLDWPALRIEFRRREPQSPGQFTLYSYDTSVGGLPPTEQRLATHTNVTVGATAAELRGAANDGVFVATSLSGGPPFDGWNVPGTQLIAFLDRDFLDPDARVRAIASPMGAALADC